jgi:hypothetical protein
MIKQTQSIFENFDQYNVAINHIVNQKPAKIRKRKILMKNEANET